MARLSEATLKQGEWSKLEVTLGDEEIFCSVNGCPSLTHRIDNGTAYGKLAVGVHEFAGKGSPALQYRNLKIKNL